jgi:hypothetical protein
MLINKNSLIAALLIFLFGFIYLYAFLSAWRDDLQFYFKAKSEVVKVEKVSVTVRRVGNPAFPGYTYEVEEELVLLTNNGARVVSGTFFGGELEAQANAASLKAIEKQKIKIYLSPQLPTHYAFELKFPWLRLVAMVVPFLVLILPTGAAIFYYFFERKRKR